MADASQSTHSSIPSNTPHFHITPLSSCYVLLSSPIFFIACQPGSGCMKQGLHMILRACKQAPVLFRFLSLSLTWKAKVTKETGYSIQALCCLSKPLDPCYCSNGLDFAVGFHAGPVALSQFICNQIVFCPTCWANPPSRLRFQSYLDGLRGPGCVLYHAAFSILHP